MDPLVSDTLADPGPTGAQVVSVNISESTGVRKRPVDRARLVEGHGLAEDAHAGDWHRQVSLLARESIDKMVAMGLDVGPGDFAENVTTSGVDLVSLPVGARLAIGPAAIVEVSQIGKECHARCAIYYQAGDCVMPREGIFAVVVHGGIIASGDAIRVLGVANEPPAGSSGNALARASETSEIDGGT